MIVKDNKSLTRSQLFGCQVDLDNERWWVAIVEITGLPTSNIIFILFCLVKLDVELQILLVALSTKDLGVGKTYPSIDSAGF